MVAPPGFPGGIDLMSKTSRFVTPYRHAFKRLFFASHTRGVLRLRDAICRQTFIGMMD